MNNYLKTFEDVEGTLRAQREGFNNLIVRLDTSRDNHIIQTRSLVTSLLEILLTISLTIGIATVPLVIFAVDIPHEQEIFVKIGGLLLLVNSVILAVRLKRIVESLAFQAVGSGLEEKRIVVKMRNYFTKSLLTKDLKYFEEYNHESRIIADDTTNSVLDASSDQGIDSTSDVALSLLVLGITVILRPLFMFVPLPIYLLLLGCVAAGLTYFVYKERISSKQYVSQINSKQRLIAEEEKDINDFVRTIINGENDGNNTPT